MPSVFPRLGLRKNTAVAELGGLRLVLEQQLEVLGPRSWFSSSKWRFSNLGFGSRAANRGSRTSVLVLEQQIEVLEPRFWFSSSKRRFSNLGFGSRARSGECPEICVCRPGPACCLRIRPRRGGAAASRAVTLSFARVMASCYLTRLAPYLTRLAAYLTRLAAYLTRRARGRRPRRRPRTKGSWPNSVLPPTGSSRGWGGGRM